jgi:hypothetical protein
MKQAVAATSYPGTPNNALTTTDPINYGGSTYYYEVKDTHIV